MPDLFSSFGAWLLEEARLAAGLRILLLLLVGWLLLRVLKRLADRMLRRRISDQAAMLTGKVILYGGKLIIFLMILNELGFQLTALLAAAGVAGIAIGFAAQTSLSNLISGLFLLWEKPFMVGDVISMGDTSGVVHSIDLLSVKMRTFDNRFIRMPNESLVKNSFINVTRFPIRRFDLNLGVAYKEDIGRVMKLLAEVADNNPHCLDEPEPVVIFTGFGDSSLNFMLGAWFLKADFMKLRNSLGPQIKARFDNEGIEIPFPHRSLYSGSKTEPFPVQIVDSAGGLTAPAGSGESEGVRPPRTN